MNNLLIINISNIGDIVSSLSVVKLLSKSYKIHFLTHEHFRELFEGEDYIKLINLNDINNIVFDKVLDFTSSSKSRKIVKKIDKNVNKYGMYTSIINFFKQKLYYNYLIPKNKYNNIVKNYYPFLEVLDIDLKDIEQYPTMNIKTKIIDKSIITIHIGARNPIRKIPLNLINDIIKYLQNRFSYPIQILGDDELLIKSILKNNTNIIYKKTNLYDLKVLIAKSKLFIGPDSGLLHISSALNTNSIGIFGPNITEVCAPLNNRVSIIEKYFECRPCNQDKECKYNIKCLNEITLDLRFKQLIEEKLNDDYTY